MIVTFGNEREPNVSLLFDNGQQFLFFVFQSLAQLFEMRNPT